MRGAFFDVVGGRFSGKCYGGRRVKKEVEKYVVEQVLRKKNKKCQNFVLKYFGGIKKDYNFAFETQRDRIPNHENIAECGIQIETITQPINLN